MYQVPSKIHEVRHDKEVYVYSLNVSGLKEYTVHPFRNKQVGLSILWVEGKYILHSSIMTSVV